MATAALLTAAACATTPDPGFQLSPEEAAELDCRLLEAGHFYIDVPRRTLDVSYVRRRIESLGYDRIENQHTIWTSERSAGGVTIQYIEAVEGDGFRYADPMCRYRSSP